MIYRVNEMFYSLKGEGQWTGTPMSFIRLAGCNLTCPFCDTLDKCNEELSEREIVHRISLWPAEHVVITGGEPLIQLLAPLLQRLRSRGLKAHLETNGILPLTTFLFFWVTVSPKVLPRHPGTITRANEIKFLVGTENWERMIDFFLLHYRHHCPTAKLYVMPLAKSIKEGDRSASDIIDENVQLAVDYCLAHPEFSYCHQLHKTLGVR